MYRHKNRAVLRSSPRRRGWSRAGQIRVIQAGVVTRTGGVGPRVSELAEHLRASSPHKRGWSRGQSPRDRKPAVVPAQAGWSVRRVLFDT